MIKNIVSLLITVLLLYVGYLLFIEKKSASEVLDMGREKIEDKALELKVRSQITFNKQFEYCDIDIKADDGEIILSGTVDAEEKIEVIGKITENVKGVEKVINRLSISAVRRESHEGGRSDRERGLDEEIRKKAEAVLRGVDKLEGAEIRINVYKKVVFLDGTVSSSAQKDIADSLVRRIDKVRDVKEELKIRQR